jgi:hypothetical protein
MYFLLSLGKRRMGGILVFELVWVASVFLGAGYLHFRFLREVADT